MQVVSNAIANSIRRAVKGVSALLIAAQGATLVLELKHGHFKEGGGSIVFRLIIVHFVDQDSYVNDLRLDNIFLNNKLDNLIDIYVVISMQSAQRRGGRRGVQQQICSLAIVRLVEVVSLDSSTSHVLQNQLRSLVRRLQTCVSSLCLISHVLMLAILCQ